MRGLLSTCYNIPFPTTLLARAALEPLAIHVSAAFNGCPRNPEQFSQKTFQEDLIIELR